MSDQKKFQKKVEDFTCLHCGKEVKGTGFTNHCPYCLYSRHVDVNPGDRSADCGGLMRPVSLEQKHGELRVVHECEVCGYQKVNKIEPEDNMDVVIAIMKSASA